MTSRTASNLMALHATACLGAWAYGGPAVLFPIGVLVALTLVAMFRCNKTYEGE